VPGRISRIHSPVIDPCIELVAITEMPFTELFEVAELFEIDA